ncbi:MAG: OmpA family protein [Elusimicrobiota bacterium]|nr:OmpA family protein [Elusimicrobiota bacterium]
MYKLTKFIKNVKRNAAILSAFLLFLPILSWGQNRADAARVQEINLDAENTSQNIRKVRRYAEDKEIEMIYIDVDEFRTPEDIRTQNQPVLQKNIPPDYETEEIDFNKPRISNRMLVAMFNQNSDEISTEIKNRIRRMSGEIRNHSYKRLIIEGFTDLNEEFAEELSISRAKVVSNEFIRNGLDPQRMQYVGFGSKIPSESNKTQNGRQANRRVMIVVE